MCRGKIHDWYGEGCRRTGDTDVVVIAQAHSLEGWQEMARRDPRPDAVRGYLDMAEDLVGAPPTRHTVQGAWERRVNVRISGPDDADILRMLSAPAPLGTFYVVSIVEDHAEVYTEPLLTGTPPRDETTGLPGVRLVKDYLAEPDPKVDPAPEKVPVAFFDATEEPAVELLHRFEVQMDAVYQRDLEGEATATWSWSSCACAASC
jgi:hypothetical protein